MEIVISSFEDALSKNSVVIIGCDCEIHYSGRAKSFLPSGGRLIIIKADKTLLVHQPAGSAPINYMKGNTSYRLASENGLLVLHCHNIPDKEFMDIFISKVHTFHIMQLEDSAKIQLAGSERDMSDMIYDTPLLIEPGFKPLSREEHTKYGFIDVFGHDKNNILVVIECKRYTADLKAVDQLQRYVRKIKQLKGLDKVRGIIASPEISPNAMQMLSDHGFEYRKISPPQYLERHSRAQKKLGEF